MRVLSSVVVVVFAVVVAVYADNWLTDLAKNVAGSGCLVTITPKLTSDCVNAFDDEVKSRPKDESDKKV